MKMHVLAGVGGTFKVVMHEPTPAGNNSAGFPWSQAIVESGKARSMLRVGNPATIPGTITQSELDSIQAGTTLEASFNFTPNPNHTPAQMQAALDVEGAAAISDMINRYAVELKWYGLTRT